MKASILFSIARQVEGEWILVNVLKANTDPEKLRSYLKGAELPLTGNFNDMDCMIEYGVITDIEIEGIDEETTE